MTEEQWLTETSVESMLAYLRPLPNSSHVLRQSLCFASECYRHVWDQLNPAMQAIVVEMERLAQDEMTSPSRKWTTRILFNVLRRRIRSLMGMALQNSGNLNWFISETAAQMSLERGMPAAVQADLLRDVVGNPFQSPPFDPVWGTESVMSLVDAIRREHRRDLIPILGDALRDAGCREPAILDHCQQPLGHYEGCWVLDGIIRAEAAAGESDNQMRILGDIVCK